MIKLNFVLENVYDKPKLQTTKTVVSSPYGGEAREEFVGDYSVPWIVTQYQDYYSLPGIEIP